MPSNRCEITFRGLLTDALGLLFAAFWALRAATALHVPLSAALFVIGPVTGALLAGFVWRDIILRRPEITVDIRLSRYTRIGRIIAFTIVGNICHIFHQQALLLPLFGLIIGISYWPLGIAMREPIHLFVGTAVVLVTLISLPFPATAHQAIAGTGTALAVWTGCALRLGRMATPLSVEQTA
ncbi:hypothetical protein AA101099_2007 [Neoasaia chiangmaiensis NBRC 101099]|uniref:Uncharacterized protein n=1 Tax=Neoasaia chiangmaiensis TaxID=320497 RepID=A0A1U9KT22_9PROT|nr:hypothetical protein [Neoasaia chiangmaiensis]AQS88986.1 hypothetical protein A0U93_14860 [Neoasaia chiangmaiensis]GBR40214.1 hypothetical protein AA101099_2007 [Neoasaia chiangmaiensis NBRC 101099]GEN14007.1 hypothetical protein NCH01_04380 [Neoasaia chiangmaiensis]